MDRLPPAWLRPEPGSQPATELRARDQNRTPDPSACGPVLYPRSQTKPARAENGVAFEPQGPWVTKLSSRIFQAENRMATSPSSAPCCWGRPDAPGEGVPVAGEGDPTGREGARRRACRERSRRPTARPGRSPGSSRDAGSSASPGSYSSRSSWSGSSRGRTPPRSAGGEREGAEGCPVWAG